MAFQSVPNGIEVVIHAVQNGTPIVNVFHVKAVGVVGDVQLLNAATAVQAWTRASLLPSLNATYIVNDWTATDISVEGGHQVVLNGESTDHGADGIQQAAGNAAVAISWRTARIGRSYRGRTYIGGFSAVQLQDAQHITSGVATVLTTAAADLIDRLEAVGLTLCVLSRFLNKVQRAVGVLTEIISIVVNTKVDSQRRRTAN